MHMPHSSHSRWSLALGNDAVCAAHADAESFDVHAFIAYAHAAKTQNAARRVVINNLRPLLFGAVNFFLHEAAGVGSVAENHVLQLALAALVAHRTIERMVGEQK